MPEFNPFSLSGLVDPFAWTDARNFGAVSARRPHTQYRSYAHDAIEWQKSVYDLAENELLEGDFDVIVDIGCGAGRKSFERFRHHKGLVQVDRCDFRDAEVSDAGIRFERASFDSWDDLDRIFRSLDQSLKTLVICADVIEHLHDPRPLLAYVRRVLISHPSNVAVLSTPDHERIDGGRHRELPANVEHVRQWSVFDFGQLLRSAGFEVTRYGLVEMNKFDELGCTIFARLKCDSVSYESFLAQAGLPNSGSRLLVTCEHKMMGRGGGIGTYAYQSEIALSFPTITLMYGENTVAKKGARAETLRQYVHVGKVVEPQNSQPCYSVHSRTAFELLDAVQTLIFFYPEISYIEIEDYQGHSHAIVQAANTGLLPSGIKTACYGHGNHHYLEVNHNEFFFDHKVHARERACLERADVTLLPSDYLSSLYKRSGLSFGKEVRLAYPYQFICERSNVHDYKKVRRIVFFGKRTRGKGYHLFGEAINLLANGGALSGVDEIVVAGVGEDEFSFSPNISGKVRYHLYPNDGLVPLLNRERGNTLAVIPYLGDNFPYSIHELIDAGVQTLFAAAGGIPEVLNGVDLDGAVFFDPKVERLAFRIAEKLSQSGIVRGVETLSVRNRFVKIQIERNKDYNNFFNDFNQQTVSSFNLLGAAPSYEVVITYHNEESRYMRDALSGIAAQTVLPKSVIVVDDASLPERLSAMEEVTQEFPQLNIQIVTPDCNIGLAAARNFGMSFVSSDFFIAHDADNVLRSDAAEKMLYTLIQNDRAGAATCHSVMFPDHHDWINRIETEARYGRYEPIAPDLGEVEANTFGDALAMYRRKLVENISGWRSSGAEPLEDFQLFYALQAAGSDVLVIPATIAMYRVRSDSMLRTYNRFGGYLRVADIISSRLGRDGLSLVRHVMEAHELKARSYPTYVVQQELARVDLFKNLAIQSLPLQLRDEACFTEAVFGRSWKTVAFRHPTKIRYWQTLRRLQRAARRNGLLA